MKQYLNLLKDIKENGVRKSDRTGTGTISVFSREIRHKMSDGFPLLTTKKMAIKQIITELLWFLKGDTNIKYLVDNNCNIWVGDAYKNYCNHTKANDSKWNKWMRDNGDGTLSMYTEEQFIDKIKNDDEFAKKWGELGPVYGKQWRKWDNPIILEDGSGEGWYGEPFDQIKNLIQLLKTNPDSRRLLVNAWNVADIDMVILPPCHYGFQCYTKEMNKAERYHEWLDYQRIHHLEDTGMSAEGAMQHYNFPIRKLSLKFQMRSVDSGLGLPFGGFPATDTIVIII
jgi:thymidylate synthase